MELKHIDIANLSVSAANMRAKGKPDIADILPSVRARGILVPLIVRPAEAQDRFEIVAGKRRYHAAVALAEESGECEPLPCAVMAAGDDAAALEASLIENVARLDPLGHVFEVSFDEGSETLRCLFQAARSAYPKSWRRAAWNKHLRDVCGNRVDKSGVNMGVMQAPYRLAARRSAPHILSMGQNLSF